MEDRLEVESRLEAGEDLLTIVDETGLKIKKVNEYKKDWLDNKNKQEVLDIARSDEGIEQAMTIFQEGLENKGIETGTLTENIEAVQGLQVLDVEIQNTCKLALQRANMFLDADNTKLTPTQWKTIVDGIASMYASIFVPQGTNINIMNNNGGGDTQMGTWKGSLR